MREEAKQVRHETLQVAFHRFIDVVVELDPDDREENDIDEQEDADGDASPLEPDHSSHSSVDCFGRVRSDTSRERRKTGTVGGVGCVVAEHVLQVDLDAVEEPEFIST